MATTKPRITITLEPKQHELLQRLAAQRNVSMSSLVSELVEAVEPSMRRVSSLMDRASKAPEMVREGIVDAVERAEQLLTELAGPSLRQRDLFDRALAEARKREAKEAGKHAPAARQDAPGAVPGRGGGVQRASAGARSLGPRRKLGAVSDPRPVTTGVRSGSNPPALGRSRSGKGGQ